MTMNYARFIFFSLLVFFAPEILVAQKMPVPSLVQAALLKKIFTFDKALSGKSTLEITVLGAGNDIVSALKSVGMNVTSGDAVEGDVVYFGPGAAAQKSSSAKAGVLSVSGIPSNAEKGLVSVALGIEDGRPKIIINKTQLKAEGHELSADLLMLARIIE
jgi:hypothetical protein